MTQDKQEAIFDGFLAIVKAPYGDFSGIGKLSNLKIYSRLQLKK